MSNAAAAYLLAAVVVSALWAWAWLGWWVCRRCVRWLEIRWEVRQCERILALMQRYDLDVDEALEYDDTLGGLEAIWRARRLGREAHGP